MAPKSKKPGWVDWRKCKGRQVLLDDLAARRLPIDNNDVTEAAAWEIYRGKVAFQDVVYDQFKVSLKRHRKQIKILLERSDRVEAAFLRDRRLHPQQSHNTHGEPVFALTEAKKKLEFDVSKGKHLRMTPAELQRSRTEYAQFNSRKFKERIYQEVRLQKYFNGRQLQYHKKQGDKK